MTTRFTDHLLTGNHAGRPTATTVPQGTLYACTTHGLIYQSDTSTWSTWATLGGGTPAAHAASHESGGSDEIDVTGLTGAGGGGGGLYPLDDITLHGTYGDHFETSTLDAKWTPRVLNAKQLVQEDSYVRNSPLLLDDWGILQPWTPTAEAEFRMAAAPQLYPAGANGYGLFLAVLNSSGTGIALGSRETSRLGIHTVTTYALSDEPVNNNSMPGMQYLSEGRKGWWSLTKNGTIYSWRFSFNGETWSTNHSIVDYVPSAFTPSQVGWLVGLTATSPSHIVPVDWFNVTEYSLGNNLMVTPTSGTVTPSAATTTGGTVGDVIDGSISDEWYVTGTANPIWWAATFSAAQSMNRLRIYSRGDLWGAGYVEFSDGSTVPFYAPINGWTCLSFPTKSTTLVKVHCLRQGQGANPGLYEVEAYLAS